MSIKVSFKDPRIYFRLVVLVVLLLALGIIAYMQVKANQETQRTYPPTADDFPLVETDWVSIPTPEPTTVISQIIDLAQGLPDEEKIVFIVQRADSSYEKYIVPSGGDLQELLNMGPNDKIVNVWPFVLLEPPPLLSPQAPVETPTESGYPLPVNSPGVSPTAIYPDTYP
jgi:hypothetical protein